MNFDICKKCKYFPSYYEITKTNKNEILFHGIQEMKDTSNFVSCIISYKGKSDKYIANKFKEHKIPVIHSETFYFEALLKDKKVKPIKKLCPYYTEHQLSDWNEK